MTTSPVGSNTSTIAGAAAAANAQAQSQLNSNYTQFLKLLTTQLQNQDPTNPADTNQVTMEIAQLSQVQGQLQTNTDLAELLSLVSSQINSDAVSYIGKQIDAAGSNGSAQTELTNGQATIVYNLPGGASNANVTITNSAGQTVFSGPGTTASGRNQVVWNGANGTTGVTEPDGTYTFTVTAKDASGNTLTAAPMTTGIVQSVDSQSGSTNLSLGGGLSVPIANVQSVYDQGSNPSS